MNFMELDAQAQLYVRCSHQRAWPISLLIAYYRNGEKPLPMTGALACHGYDALAVKAA